MWSSTLKNVNTSRVIAQTTETLDSNIKNSNQVQDSSVNETNQKQDIGTSKNSSDYLIPTTASVECSKPVENRKGAWYCPNITRTAAREIAAAAQRDLGSKAVSKTEVAASASQYCTDRGCWSILDNYRSSYVGGGSYGYGETTLGDARMYFKVTATGTKLTVGPMWFRSTRGTLVPQLEVEVLYISAAYPQGNSQNPRQSNVRSYGGILGAGNELDWPMPYPAWYQTIQVPTVVVEPVWRDPSSAYPGRWFMYAKSIKYQRGSNGQYFIPSLSLPKDPAGAGFRP